LFSAFIILSFVARHGTHSGEHAIFNKLTRFLSVSCSVKKKDFFVKIDFFVVGVIVDMARKLPMQVIVLWH
jgi:hypothetical protein